MENRQKTKKVKGRPVSEYVYPLNCVDYVKYSHNKRTGYGHKDYSSLCHINSPLYEKSELKWKLKKIKKKIQFKSNGNFNMDFFTHKKKDL